VWSSNLGGYLICESLTKLIYSNMCAFQPLPLHLTTAPIVTTMVTMTSSPLFLFSSLTQSGVVGVMKPRPKSAAVKGNLKLRLDSQLQSGSAIVGTSPRKTRPTYNTPIKKGTILATDLTMCPYEEYGCEGLIVSVPLLLFSLLLLLSSS